MSIIDPMLDNLLNHVRAFGGRQATAGCSRYFNVEALAKDIDDRSATPVGCKKSDDVVRPRLEVIGSAGHSSWLRPDQERSGPEPRTAPHTASTITRDWSMR